LSTYTQEVEKNSFRITKRPQDFVAFFCHFPILVKENELTQQIMHQHQKSRQEEIKMI